MGWPQETFKTSMAKKHRNKEFVGDFCGASFGWGPLFFETDVH